MATYDPNTTVTRGWGQMFQQFFKGDVTVNNRAKNGASSKSFYKESAYWQSVILAAEGITRRELPLRFQTAINAAGMILLLMLMVLTTMQDVAKYIL